MASGLSVKAKIAIVSTNGLSKAFQNMRISRIDRSRVIVEHSFAIPARYFARNLRGDKFVISRFGCGKSRPANDALLPRVNLKLRISSQQHIKLGNILPLILNLGQAFITLFNTIQGKHPSFAITMLELPSDFYYMVCEELANRQDFGTLFNCALSSKVLVGPALLWLYR